MTRLVLFDCDGTLVDSQHAIVASMSHAFMSQNLPAPPRMRTLSVVGLSLPEAMAILAHQHSKETQDSLVESYRAGANLIRERGETDVLYPGIADLIAMMGKRSDLTLGIATGKSHRGVQRLFEHFGWGDYFTTIQTADNNPSKPHPQMILSAMAETGAAAHETVMIGDSSFDIAMARAAGVRSIGVAWGYHTPAVLTAAGAGTIANDARDLAEVLDSMEYS